MDADDEFVFEDELSSNIGSSVTVFDDKGEGHILGGGERGGRRERGPKNAPVRIPLIRKLLKPLSLYRSRGSKGEGDCGGGGKKGMRVSWISK